MATPGQVTRRRFAHLGALSLAGLSAHSLARTGRSDPDPELSSDLLMELELELDTGDEPLVPQHAVSVIGGRFRGPQLQGTVRGGGVWYITRPDGTEEITLHATLRTDDDHAISVRSRGLIDPRRDGTRYTRATPIFETASPRYNWLNRLVTVGVGHAVGTTTSYRVYEVG